MFAEICRTASFFHNHPVAKRQKLSTWKRWLSWQIRSRIMSGEKQMQWIEGATLVVDRGMTGATGNLYVGLHEFADMAFVLHFLEGKADSSVLFLDVGANVGTYTVLASGVCRVQTVALEPGEFAFAGLRRNIEANQIEAIADAHCVAAGGEVGSLRFSTDRDTPMNQIVNEDYAGETVHCPVTTIDQLLGERVPSLIKMDVEGHESAALSGAMKCLADPNVEAVLVEAGDPDVIALLAEAGFVCVDYDPMKRCTSSSGYQRNLGNHLWVRDADLVTATCQSARKFNMFGFGF